MAQKKSSVIVGILKFFFIIVVLGLIAIWLITGGAQATWNFGKGFLNPVAYFNSASSSGAYFTLPGQPQINLGTDISQYANSSPSVTSSNPSNASSFGSPSSYAGEVTLSARSGSTNAAHEYVVISSSASAPISITGWTLQSAVSEVWAQLPEAAPVFMGGVVNAVSPVALPPGGQAIVVTGPSPVGVSFEENTCAGYLAVFQNFTPAFSRSCPAPADALPETADTLRTYGSTCFDYLATLDSCTTPGAQLPANLSPACRSFASQTFTYNGCVGFYRSSASFALPVWRLYLGLARPLWNPSHDVIRLLDNQGRIVDVLTY